jgi:hypothetical protein
MGIAIAGFHWTPADFWNATPHEFYPAYYQWVENLKLIQPNVQF